MCIFRKSVYPVIACRVFFVLMAMGNLASSARAGVQTSGVKIQGPSLQGTEYDGKWLQGTQILGVLPGDTSGLPGADDVLLEIHGFGGETVTGTLHAIRRGTRKRVTLHPRELVGLEWADEVCFVLGACKQVVYRVSAVQQDLSRNTMPAHADNHDVWLYQVHYTTAGDPAPQDWQSVCPQADGHEPAGLFVNGRWDRRGRWSPRGYTFSCAAGIIAKCARGWGYKPWKQVDADSAGRISLRPLHLACVRAARADYCGDGIPHTVEGTPIDMFDAHGLNVPAGMPGFTAESAFGPRKAAWVERPRYPIGIPGHAGWRFDTCMRPYAHADADADAALLHVWSRSAL